MNNKKNNNDISNMKSNIELMRKIDIEKNTTPIVYKMFNILIIKSKNIVNKIKEEKNENIFCNRRSWIYRLKLSK